ncbi:MAG TPA: DoxX family protein [Tepidisphaeraceae bacterium]|nr:DoxX family protein [Tepidisphaeraceae bacterium]
MRNPLKTDNSISLGLLLARLPMGLFFLLAGYAKYSHGVGSFVSKYGGAMPGWAPPEAGNFYMHAIPYLEVIVGILLIVGFLTRLCGLVGALMVLSYMIAVTGVRDASLPFHPNSIYLGLLLMVFLVGPGRISLDHLLMGRRRRTPARAAARTD